MEAMTLHQYANIVKLAYDHHSFGGIMNVDELVNGYPKANTHAWGCT